MDIGATWCFPCWEYHQTGALEEFTQEYGPNGSDVARVLFIEGDVQTSLEDLQGTGPTTLGDWITGKSYSILQLGGIPALYDAFGLPFTYLVCPDRTVKLIGEVPAEFLAEEVAGCIDQEQEPEPDFSTLISVGCEEMEVQFVESSWPRPDSYLWEFGDGSTSTVRQPTHTYTAPGDYEVTLTVGNTYGETSLSKTMAVQIGAGAPAPNQRVGKLDTLGSGRIFRRGVQGLLFDAHQDLILSSATVYSDRDEWRTFVVTDTNEVLYARRDIWIPEGEQRIQLDMMIPQGDTYRIGMWSDAWLYRNDGDTDYPYAIDDLVTINSSTVPTDPTGFYYYLYDWEVRSQACAQTSSISSLNPQSIQFSPNPVEELLVVESEDPLLHEATVLNLGGESLQIGRNYTPGRLSLEVGSLPAGTYILKVGTQTKRFIKL